MSAPSAIEGAVSVRLRVADGVVRQAEVAVRRPTAVARALVGRSPDEVVRLVPLLFSLCGTAQGLAAAMACETALGIDGTTHAGARALMLDAEAADNHAWQIAMEWPLLLGERPDPPALLALRAAVPTVTESLYPARDGLRPGGGSCAPTRSGWPTRRTASPAGSRLASSPAPARRIATGWPVGRSRAPPWPPG